MLERPSSMTSSTTTWKPLERAYSAKDAFSETHRVGRKPRGDRGAKSERRGAGRQGAEKQEEPWVGHVVLQGLAGK